MDNQHKKISGYRDLSQYEIDLMNKLKVKAAECGELVEELQSMGAVLDQQCVELGKTNLQQGFMWAIRSVAQPTNFG